MQPQYHVNCYLYLHIIRKSQRSIGVMKYIPQCTSVFLKVGVSLILFFLRRRPISANMSSAAFGFWPLRLVLFAMHYLQRSLQHTRLLIWVRQRSISRLQCSGLVPWLLIILKSWAISQTCSLTVSSIHCVVKPRIFCQFPKLSAANSLTPTLAFSAPTRTCRLGIWIVLASATTDSGIQKASHCSSGHQW